MFIELKLLNDIPVVVAGVVVGVVFEAALQNGGKNPAPQKQTGVF